MSNPLIIRAVATTDFTQWQSLWEGYNRFYGRNALPFEITQTTWSRFFDTNEPMHAMVAEQNGQLLGLAHYLFHRSTIAINLTCYLQDLFTDPAARSQGVGRALLEAVYEQASIAGAPRVYWQTQENNQVARKLYDKVAELSSFVIYTHPLLT